MYIFKLWRTICCSPFKHFYCEISYLLIIALICFVDFFPIFLLTLFSHFTLLFCAKRKDRKNLEFYRVFLTLPWVCVTEAPLKFRLCFHFPKHIRLCYQFVCLPCIWHPFGCCHSTLMAWHFKCQLLMLSRKYERYEYFLMSNAHVYLAWIPGVHSEYN